MAAWVMVKAVETVGFWAYFGNRGNRISCCITCGFETRGNKGDRRFTTCASRMMGFPLTEMHKTPEFKVCFHHPQQILLG